MEEDEPGAHPVLPPGGTMPVACPRAAHACADGLSQAPTVALGTEIPTDVLKFVWKLSHFVYERSPFHLVVFRKRFETHSPSLF